MQFNPIEVPIVSKLNYLQIELILEGLGKLPHERVDQIHASLKDLAIATLRHAEQEFMAKEKAKAEAEAESESLQAPAESEGGEAE